MSLSSEGRKPTFSDSKDNLFSTNYKVTSFTISQIVTEHTQTYPYVAIIAKLVGESIVLVDLYLKTYTSSTSF